MSLNLSNIMAFALALSILAPMNVPECFTKPERHFFETDQIDRVVSFSRPACRVYFAQCTEPPASPCTIVGYAACNYPLPPNDSVSFSLSGEISFASCPADQLNSATITFQATPNVPIFVWLSNATSSTSPVYMTGANLTITKAWFGGGSTSWFGGGPWTTLNVQAIYPSPPPTGYYYPISCTIVYQ